MYCITSVNGTAIDKESDKAVMARRIIKCPLMDMEIDEGICYDIHMNVEGLAPEWTIPKKVLKISDYKKLCLQCLNHRDD